MQAAHHTEKSSHRIMILAIMIAVVTFFHFAIPTEPHRYHQIHIVADVFDALSSERPYHAARGYEESLRMIREESGSHFDPAVVAAFLKIDRQEIEAVLEKYRDDKS